MRNSAGPLRLACIVLLLTMVQGVSNVLQPCSEARASYNISETTPSLKADVQSSQQGNGFHRSLSLTLSSSAKPDFAVSGNNTHGTCQIRIVLLQCLPPALFVDPYELQRPQLQQGDQSFHLFGKVDLESPEVAAEPTAVLVELHRQPAQLLTASVTLPVHVKYPAAYPVAPTELWWQWFISGYADIPVPQPQWFARWDEGCGVGPEGSGGWWQLEGDKQGLVVRVPAGNVRHLAVVSWVTLLFSLVCCAAVAAGAWKWGSF